MTTRRTDTLLKLALKVSNEYYAKNGEADDGAASGIIAPLEGVESRGVAFLIEVLCEAEPSRRL